MILKILAQNCSNNETLLNSTYTFSVNASQFMLCTNATPITNQNMWVDYIWLSTSIPINHTPQIVHIPQICTNVSIASNKHLVYFNISFPQLKLCIWKKGPGMTFCWVEPEQVLD